MISYIYALFILSFLTVNSVQAESPCEGSCEDQYIRCKDKCTTNHKKQKKIIKCEHKCKKNEDICKRDCKKYPF